jgi:hypothetical protein
LTIDGGEIAARHPTNHDIDAICRPAIAGITEVKVGRIGGVRQREITKALE